MARKVRKKFSTFDFVVHETRAALRQEKISNTDFGLVHENLASLQEKELGGLIKYGSYLLIGTIATNALSNDGLLSIKTALVELQIPKIYAVFACVLIWSGMALKGFSILQIIVHRVLAYQILTPNIRFGAASLGHSSRSGFDTISPLRNEHLVRFPLSTSAFIGAPLFLLFLGALTPTFGIFIYLLSEAWSSLFANDGVFLARLFSISACAMLLLPFLYIFLHFKKFTVVKDEGYVRWGFLSRIFPAPHRNTERWIREK